MKEKTKMEKQKVETNLAGADKANSCGDVNCPFHGSLKARGRSFEGKVVKKLAKRVAIEFARDVYVKKYERFASSRTKIHARLPDCVAKEIKVGDLIQIKECRPLSKIIHFVVVKKIKDAEDKS